MSLRQTTKLFDYRGNVIQTHPTIEPVTLDEFKSYLRLSGSSEDQQLVDLIEEARQTIEDLLGIALITQTWKMAIDRWPTQREPWWDGTRQGHIGMMNGPAAMSSLRLPRYPLQSVTSVTTYDEDSNATSVTVADVFDVDAQQAQGRITLRSGATWPIALRANNAIEIVYVAGYGDDAVDVPAPIKRAIRQLAAYLYSHRGDGCETGVALKDSGAMSAINIYKVAKV